MAIDPIANPWAQWGIIQTLRDGYPAVNEAVLWQLSGTHPEVFERVSATEVYLHLDQPYRLVTIPDRSYTWLIPAPERTRPAAGTKG